MVVDDDSTGGRTGEMTKYYKVADFVFAVTLGGNRDLEVLLPSFSVFECSERPEGDLLFKLVEEDIVEDCPLAEFLEEDVNDMGHTCLYRVDDRYRVTVRYAEFEHVMEAEADFRQVSAKLKWEDPFVSAVLCSMLRIAFAQATLLHSAVSIHSSTVLKGGKAYMFMGRSGTGKSTHSRLWIEHLGAALLNDDNPIVRIVDGKALVYGSPWSGKTPCYKDKSAPIAAMVRLAQAPENRFERKSEIEAFAILLPGCSVLRFDRNLYGNLCETLIELAELVCVGEMRCLPDMDAARTCWEGVNE